MSMSCGRVLFAFEPEESMKLIFELRDLRFVIENWAPDENRNKLTLTLSYDEQVPAACIDLVAQGINTWRPENKVYIKANFNSAELAICTENQTLATMILEKDQFAKCVNQSIAFEFTGELDAPLIRASGKVIKHELQNEYREFRVFGQLQDYCWNLNTLNDVYQVISVKNSIIISIPESNEEKVAEYNKLGLLSVQLFRIARKLRDINTAVSFFERAIVLIEEYHKANTFLLVQTLMLYYESLNERYMVFAKSDDFHRMLSSQQQVLGLLSDYHPISYMALTNKASAYLLHSQRSVDLGDVNKAIGLLSQATHHIHASSDTKIPLLSGLGSCYGQRYIITTDAKDIVKAIDYQHHVLDTLPDNSPNLPVMLNNLAGLHSLRLQETGDSDDFDISISIRRDILNKLSESDSLYVDVLCSMGNSYFRRFEHTQSLKDIDEAISMLKRGVDLSPEGDVLKPKRITDFGNLYLERAKFFGNPEDSDKGIECYRRSISITPEGHPEYDPRIRNLIAALEDCFVILGHIDDIDEAIYLQRAYVENTSVEMFGDLHVLSRLLYQRYSKSDSLNDLKEAISVQRRAFKLTPTTDPSFPAVSEHLLRLLHELANHSKSLEDIDSALTFGERISAIISTPVTGIHGRVSSLWQLRFKTTSIISDIDQAISNQREVVQELGSEPAHSKVLAGLLINRYRANNCSEDIDEAIVILQTSFNMKHSDTGEFLMMLCQIGSVLLSDHDNSGDIDSFYNGVTLFEEALKRCPREHTLLPAIMGTLGAALLNGFSYTGNMKYLDYAVSTLEQVSECMRPDSPNINVNLFGLGEALRIRYETTGNTGDLERSIKLLQEAIENASSRGISSPHYYSSLGMSLLRLYLLGGSEGVLEDALLYCRRAMDEAEENSSDKHVYFSHLGNCLLRKFELTGNFEDIDEAISLQQAAVQDTSGSHTELLTNLVNLANAFQSRFNAANNKEDIVEAVTVLRSARSLLKNENSSNKPMVLDNLAAAIVEYFPFEKDPELLLEGIDAINESMAMVDYSHPFKPFQIHILSMFYMQYYELTGDLKYVRSIIRVLKDALNHPTRTPLLEMTALQNLGWATRVRYGHLNNPADIDRTVSYYERALAGIPETNVTHIKILLKLAEALELRFRNAGNQKDLSTAVNHYRHIATNPTAAATERFEAATRWARALRTLDDERSLEGYALSIELLQSVAWLGESISERHEKLSSRSSLVNEATAAAFHWGRTDLALQWLENGRNIVWKQLNTFRTPIDDLHDKHPELAEQLKSISRNLDRLSSQSRKQTERMTLEQKINVQSLVRKQRDLARQWDETLAMIRGLDGFEYFLRPADVSVFNKNRPAGTVIVINVAKERCDALALRQGHIDSLHIPLEKFTYVKAESLRKTLVAHLTKSGVRSRGPRSGRPAELEDQSDTPFEDILRQLWVCVVEPIFNAMKLEPSSTPQRVWWCATGPLAFLPLHAAGIYTGDEARMGSITSDYVVSSYTPTLNTLLARTSCKISGHLERLLVVTQPETPRMLPLPQTVDEGKRILHLMESSGIDVIHLNDRHATVDSVVDSMESSDWIHLACHAIQDPKNPTKSGFYFHDGSLEMSELIAKHLPHANFAFLSACETGTGDEKLPEEAVHLAAGVLQAGYKNVVATMWAIDDSYAPIVAEKFYKTLLGKGTPPDSGDAAYALQEAVKGLRNLLGDSDSSFLTWVPYLHFGL